MSDLKPCPFCGGEAVLNHGYMITATGQYLANVKCSECGIASRVVWSTDSPEEAVKETIEAWNRRAEPERKKGEWVVKEEDWRKQQSWNECSECGFATSRQYNFCPNCGADMRGKNGKA